MGCKHKIDLQNTLEDNPNHLPLIANANIPYLTINWSLLRESVFSMWRECHIRSPDWKLVTFNVTHLRWLSLAAVLVIPLVTAGSPAPSAPLDSMLPHRSASPESVLIPLCKLPIELSGGTPKLSYWLNNWRSKKRKWSKSGVRIPNIERMLSIYGYS